MKGLRRQFLHTLAGSGNIIYGDDPVNTFRGSKAILSNYFEKILYSRVKAWLLLAQGGKIFVGVCATIFQ